MLGFEGAPVLVRIARREARRRPRRSALIVALIALPVAIVSCGLVVQSTLQATASELRTQDVGRADLLVGEPDFGFDGGSGDEGPRPPGDPSRVERALWEALPPGSEAVPLRRTRLNISSGDRATSSVVIATDSRSGVNDGRFRLDRGHLPRADGEAALAPGVARELDVAVGDSVTLEPGGVHLEVVGLARTTSTLRTWTVVVPAGTVRTTGWAVDLAPGTDVATAMAALRDVPALAGIRISDAASGVERPQALDPSWYMIGGLALAWTGVVAAATFAIGARTRLREVGLVAAAGGTRRQVRRLLLADGLVLGLCASCLGLLVGVVLAVPVIARLARDADRDPGGLLVPVLAELGAVAMGTTAAVLAARWPAIRAARLPTQAALQARITRPPRRVRSTIGGLAAVVSGALILASGAASNAEAAIVGGTLLVVAGVAMLHRLLIDLVARLARNAPLALRFAARDASRQASRTGPAVVASMLALAAAVAAATITSTAAARDANSPQQRGLYPPGRMEIGLRPSDQNDAAAGPMVIPERDGAAVQRAATDALGARRAGMIWWATAPSDRDDARAIQVISPDALEVLDITQTEAIEALDRGEGLRIDSGALSSPAAITAADGTEQEVPTVDITTGTVGVLDALAISPQAADRLGLTYTTSLSVIVDLGRPVREDDLPRAHAVALAGVDPRLQIWAGAEDGNCCGKRTFAFAALGLGLAIALPVLGLVAALVRSEARAELAVLDATGIAPRRRRRFAAAGMGLLAAFASILAVPAGLIPAVLYLQAGGADVTTGSRISIPLTAIATVVLGVPLALAGIGWLTAGRPRPLVALRE